MLASQLLRRNEIMRWLHRRCFYHGLAGGLRNELAVFGSRYRRVLIAFDAVIVDDEGRPVISHIYVLHHRHAAIVHRQPLAVQPCGGTAWSSPWMVSRMITIRKSSGAPPASRKATNFA